MISDMDVRRAAEEFLIDGDYAGATRHGSGHIHDTFRVSFAKPSGTAAILLQRINVDVFRDPGALMENIQRVTAHLQAKCGDLPDGHRRALQILSLREGGCLLRDESGWWRAYQFIEGSHSRDVVETASQAHAAASAFGQFQAHLADLPAPRLHDTIPNFHHTPARFAALQRAIEMDTVNRAALVGREIDFALKRESLTLQLVNRGLPERITHNDTKLNNVLLDDRTGKGICVIDLDTVMAGLAPYDFGDLVRTSVSPAPEDERDLSKVTLRMPVFEALARGYLATAGGFLTPLERDCLAISGRVITFEMGLRFLTDYLEGDTYYKTHRNDHNLDRCRTQFRLVEILEAEEDALQRLVNSISDS